MLAQLPNETEVLIFNGNNVPFLRNNLIGMTEEHELLKVIDMSMNKIREITGKAFHKVRNVEKLILDHNDLSISGKQKQNRVLLKKISIFFMNFDMRWFIQERKWNLIFHSLQITEHLDA